MVVSDRAFFPTCLEMTFAHSFWRSWYCWSGTFGIFSGYCSWKLFLEISRGWVSLDSNHRFPDSETGSGHIFMEYNGYVKLDFSYYILIVLYSKHDTTLVYGYVISPCFRNSKLPNGHFRCSRFANSIRPFWTTNNLSRFLHSTRPVIFVKYPEETLLRAEPHPDLLSGHSEFRIRNSEDFRGCFFPEFFLD